MKQRISSNFYSTAKMGYNQKLKSWVLIDNEEGYLYSEGKYKTKILPQDLPEWYVEGFFFRRRGWINTKGITDTYYRPCYTSNHFLKDDCLYFCYNGQMDIDLSRDFWDIVRGYDYCVYGSEILKILSGAVKWSGAPKENFISMLEDKLKWLKGAYPKDYPYLKVNVREYFERCE